MTNENIKVIRDCFYGQRQTKDYVSMGWMFWDLFVVAELTVKQRAEVSSLWNSLTKREKKLCEQVR